MADYVKDIAYRLYLDIGEESMGAKAEGIMLGIFALAFGLC
jgi:hypothetical protein